MPSNEYNIDTLDVSKIDTKDIFALDTNVLYWTHYSKASDPNLRVHPYQVTKYPNFVEKLLENGNTLVTTMFNITELIHVVENSEFKIYKAINTTHIKKKDFRNMEEERIKYKNEIETILLQINSSYEGQIKVIDLNEDDINNFVENITNNSCDVFDYVVIDHLKDMGINNFITDDKDFKSIDGINVYFACD
ncbi:PIN domain-containing protein [Clostridium sp. 001]|uniref:PIN domain-containing protein n=1 Tax=Clostridium sp. 001 TaxID=1970093 RepID=UPI001C2C886E|nr:PIN domain-containing protein [Clostridium sp. 001]QXE18850.1 hypothetical protein B5S50_08410 [Clostridium sp. 001]